MQHRMGRDEAEKHQLEALDLRLPTLVERWVLRAQHALLGIEHRHDAVVVRKHRYNSSAGRLQRSVVTSLRLSLHDIDRR